MTLASTPTGPTRPCLVVALAALLAGGAAAQVPLELYGTDPTRLSPDVRWLVLEAAECYDHVNYIDAVRRLSQAAELSPECIGIQAAFVTAARDHVRLGSFSLDEALEIGHRSLVSYDRILTNPDLPGWAKPLVLRHRAELAELLGSVSERLRIRAELSSLYLQQMSAMLERQDRLHGEARRQLRAELNRRRQTESSSGPEEGNADQVNPLLPVSHH